MVRDINEKKKKKKCMRNTEIQVDDNNSSNMTAALKIIYTTHRGTKSCYNQV